MAQSVNSISQQISNISQSAPSLEDSQLFGRAITDLLKQYQSIEKYPFAGQEIAGLQAQAKRLSSTNQDLIGAAPNVQSAARSADVASVQPTISGAQTAGQTFSSRLQTFGDVLNSASAIQQQATAAAEQAKQDAMSLINNTLANFGPDAFNNANPQDIIKLEKLAGVPGGFIKNTSDAIRAREAEQYRQQQELIRLQKAASGAYAKQLVQNEFGENIGSFDPSTGQINYYQGFGPSDNPQIVNGPTDAERAAGMSLLDRGGQQSVQSFQRIPKQLLTQVQNIAGDFRQEQIVKDFNSTANKYQSVLQIINGRIGGPGDLSLVFEFMKGLDPNSVVREGEYDTAAKSGNIFRGALARYNGYLKENGGFLPNSVKQGFLSILNTKLQVATKQYNNLYNEYARRINNITGLQNGTSYLTDYAGAFSPTSGGSSGTTSSGLSYTIIPN